MIKKIYLYLLLKIIDSNRKELIGFFFIKSNIKNINKIKFIFNTFILNIYLKLINNIIKNSFKYLLNDITKTIHPLDIYTMFSDFKNNGNDSGNINFLKKYNNKKTLIKNLTNTFSGELINIFGENHPKYIQKYFLEWLFIYSNENIKLVKKTEINGKETESFIYDILYLSKNIDLLYIKIIMEYFLSSEEKLNCTHKSKEDYEKILKNKKSNINDISIKLEFLSRFFIHMNKNDMIEEFNNYHNINRLKFISKNMSNFNFVSEYFPTFFLLYGNISNNALGNNFIYNKEKDDKLGNIKKLIELFGEINNEEYSNIVKKRGEKYYFSEVNNILNKKLYNEEFPFIEININKHYGMNDKIDKGYKLYNIIIDGIGDLFIKKIRNKIGKDKFGDFFEEYLSKYFKFQIEIIGGENFSKKYKYGNSIKYYKALDLELDFYIYNKETKKIILFELKVKDELNDKIHHRKNILNLTKNGGEIYKGVNQLLKHKHNLNKINNFLDLDGIIDAQYIFINYSKSMTWNMIIRHFINLNSNFNDFIYSFISLQEYEELINQCCVEKIDFFELLNRKNSLTLGLNYSDFFGIYSKSKDGELNIKNKHGEKIGFIEDDLRHFLNYTKKFNNSNYVPFELIEKTIIDKKGKFNKIFRKGKCICGSGKKFKRCCGK